MSSLSLVEIPVRMREFTQWALERRWLDVPRGDGSGRPREPEPGYALHAALSSLFGAESPRPFSLSPPSSAGARSRNAVRNGVGLHSLMGYSTRSREELVALMRCAPLDVQAAPER